MNYYNDYGYGAYDSAYNSYQSTSSALGLAGFGIFMWLITMAISVLLIVSMWKVFKKAGKPGWAAIVPIYNIYVMLEIAGKPAWYILLFLVPFVNIYAMFVAYDGVAKRFGKSTGFTIGMILLPVVFWPLLAFSKNTDVVGEASVQNSEPTYSMNSNNNVNNFEPQMPVNNAPVSEPVMQNTFDNSFAMNEAPAMNAEPVNSMNFNNDVSNFGPQMPVNNAPVNEPVMQNTVDNSFTMNEEPAMNAEPVNSTNFNTRFNNTQTNPNDIFNNPNGNM